MGKIKDFLNTFFGGETYAQRQERLYQKNKKKNDKKQSTAITEAESTPAPDVNLEQETIFVRPAYERDFSYADREIYFYLSGDFLEFNSHCELDPSYIYEPDNPAKSTGYKEGVPIIWFGSTNEVYDAVESYLTNGTAGKNFEKLENEFFLFAATVDYARDNLRIYAFRDNTAYGLHFALALQYPKQLEGTELESKLLEILNEAATTYDEIE